MRMPNGPEKTPLNLEIPEHHCMLRQEMRLQGSLKLEFRVWGGCSSWKTGRVSQNESLDPLNP